MNAEEKSKFRESLLPTLLFTALVWSVKVAEVAFDVDFSVYGNYPRTLLGSLGILTSPLIHANFQHLVSNTFPLIFLGVGLFYFHRSVAWQVVLIIYLLSGFWVWLAAREAYHIGASGIVYGFMAYLLLSGFLRKDRPSLAVSFVILLLYGGSMFIGLFPTAPGISWESHLMGAVAGIFCAVLFRNSPGYSVEEAAPEENEAANKSEYRYNYTRKPSQGVETKVYSYKLDVNSPDSNERAEDSPSKY